MKPDECHQHLPSTRTQERSYHLITLSARSEQAVRQLAKNLNRHLRLHPDLPLGDLAYTYHVGRRSFEHRLTVTAADGEELIKLSEQAGHGDYSKGVRYAAVSGKASNGQIAFLFTGQGSQYSGMGRELYESSSVFKRVIDECAAIIQPHLTVPLLDCLFDESYQTDLNETHVTQPALFALEYALAQLWMSWGVRPAAVIGHSLGEYVAACVAGAMSLQDALLLVVERGRLMQELCQRGAMVSVMASHEAIQSELQGLTDVSVSAVNAADQVVIAGRSEAIDELCGRWEQRGVVFKKLPVSHAFHSPLIEPMLRAFAEQLQNVTFQPLAIPIVSNLTGRILHGEVLDADYWCKHLREPVQFSRSLEALAAQDIAVWLEVGPHPVLKRLADRAASSDQLVISSLKRGEDGWKAMSDQLGLLYSHGVVIDWRAFDADFTRKRLHVPTYPFELKSYWLDVDRSMTGAGVGEPSGIVHTETPVATLTAATKEAVWSPDHSRSQAFVSSLWYEVLGVEARRRDEDFFELGGDSLNVIQVQNRIREKTGVLIEFQEFFQRPTLGELSSYLDELLGYDSGAADAKINRLSERERGALSDAQQRMWFLTRIAPDSTAYHISHAVRVHGTFNLAVLERSLNEVVRRHDALRTTFAEVDGRPHQVIAPNLYLPIPVVGVAHGEQVEHLLTAAASEAFDLSTGPLLRVKLFSLGTDEHMLSLTMHHIISDGWSMGVLVRELLTLYRSFADDLPSPLQELPIQYIDYAHWQIERLQSGELDKQAAYWKKQLGGDLPILELPADRPRPAVRTYRGALRKFELSKALTEQLEALSQSAGTTLNTVLLAAFSTLLHRYTGQEDILVGLPIAGRSHSEIEHLIGVFINTLVLRTDLSGNPTFHDLIGRVHRTALDAYANAEVPFEQLVNDLQAGRDRSHSPLFQVLFVLQNAPTAALELSGLTFTPLEVDTGTAKFDLTVMLYESEAGLTGTVEYNTDLFDPATIANLVQHFENLLAAVVREPQQSISHLPMLTDAERHKLLIEWNDTATAEPRGLSVHQLFEAQAERTPDAVAVTAGDVQLTYRELNEKANRLAHRLQKIGVGPDQLVGVCMHRSSELAIALLGVLKAGGAYVPLDPDYPQERLAFVLGDTQVKVLVTQEHLLLSLPVTEQVQAICLDSARADFIEESVENPDSGVALDNLAYVIYTSGSTGKPKGVMIEHRGFANYMNWATEAYGATAGQGAPVHSSIAFDLTVTSFYAPLLVGGRVVLLPESQDIGALGETIRSNKQFSLVKITPAHLQLLSQQLSPQEMAGRINTLVIGGEALSGEQVRAWQEFAPDTVLINEYGPTETVVGCCVYRVLADERYNGVIPIGRPIANTQMYVLDRYLQPVPVGVYGEVYIGGDGVARGYLNRPDLTAERFLPDPFRTQSGARLYRTGDLARWLPNGQMQYVDRMDDQVKIRGFRIELGEIEDAISHHPAVHECKVIVREDVPGDKRLTAYTVVAAGRSLDIGELRGVLKQSLPEYMVPAAFVELDRLPLTQNGKVDRRALPAPDLTSQISAAYVAPQTETEREVARIFQAVLGVERVSVHDDFFQLGGHSLLATQVMSRLAQSFGLQLPLRLLFEVPSVAELSSRLEAECEQTQGAAAPILPSARGEVAPLSFAQERLWFLEQLNPGEITYNIPVAVRMTGRLDQQALQQSLAMTVQRHEALRTTFTVIDGQAVQRVREQAKLPLLVNDLRDLTFAEREERLAEWAHMEAQTPFDFENGPMLRARLLQLGEDEHVLVLTMHHIVSDGWSMSLLIEEVAVLYQAFSKGEPSPLSDLPIQYTDYAVWQREHLQGEVLEKQLNFWKSQLAGELPVLQLPTDRPRQTVRSQAGKTQRFTLAPALTERLRDLSRREGATLYMTLLGAYKVLLHRYSGQHDILVGSPIAGRNRAEIEPLIGFFVNTLVLRTDFSGEPTFRELLQRVRQVTLDAYDHQDMPFEKLVHELHVDRTGGFTPLFQAAFDLQTAVDSQIELPGLSLERLPLDTSTAKFDLTLGFEEEADRLRGTIEYNAHLFDDATIARMIGHLKILLGNLLDQPELPISRLSLLPEPEREQLLVDWVQTVPSEKPLVPLHVLLAEQAAKHPERIAVVYEDQSLTYAELNQQANRLAHHLQKLSVGPDTLVGLSVERSLEMVVGILGILKAGGAYVPLDPAAPKDRLAFLVEDADLKVLVTQQHLLEVLPEHGAHVVALDSDWAQIEQESADDPASTVTAENLAYVIYTSGSTGRPKGVLINHAHVVRLFASTEAWYEFNEADVWTMFHSYAFDFSVWELWGALLYGGKLVVVPYLTSRSPEAFYQLLVQEGVTVLNQTPSAFRQLIWAEGEAGPSNDLALRYVIFGGEALELQSLKPWYDRHGDQTPQLVNMYGITETTVHVTYRPLFLADVEEAKGSVIGVAIPDLQVYVLDQHLQPVPIGVTGEMYVGGAGVARGYLNRPELTAERFLEHPYRAGERLYKTGDLARYLANGDLEYIGRIDHQVKIRGFRIELGEIEATLVNHPQVREAVVLAREDVPGDKRLVAYLVADREQEPTVQDLRQHLMQHLPEYMVPSAFVMLEAFPLTINGKTDTRALPAPEDTVQRQIVYVAPRTETEVRLADIFGELLHVEQVGLHDNFFELGGHSLLATQLLTRVRQSMQIELPLRKLFEISTIEGLAAVIEQEKAGGGQQEQKPKLAAVSRAGNRAKRTPSSGRGR